MNTRNLLTPVDHQRPTGRIVLPLGFWTRSAMVGTLIAGAGIASLIDPTHGMQFLTALTSIVAGGTVAWFAWHRAVALSDGIDEDVPTRSDRKHVPPARPVARAPAW